MPLDIRENISLAPFTTFRIGGAARFFAEANTSDVVSSAAAWAKAKGVPLFLLGGGSNLLVRDEGFHGLVLQMRVCGVGQQGPDRFAVGAGENWDGFVQQAVDGNFAGIECLAGIPGSVGGTPVQNVGAYGQEVAETIVAVHAFDLQKMAFVEFDKTACNFRYRASRFNTDEPGRYIVCRVDFQLRPNGPATLHYADLQRRFSDVEKPPSLTEVATIVREVRRSKGMLLVEGDADTQSAGSYFKNPIVPEPMMENIASAAGVSLETVPHWPAANRQIKLSAAWLLERSGFVKGYGSGSAQISTRHTLALTNRGGATSDDILQLEQEIVTGVRARFSVQLEREPVLLG